MTLPPENTIGIYKITSPSGRVYIGQSNNIRKRWSHYKSLDTKGQRRLDFSFKRYGVDKHQFEVLITCSFNELNEYERYYQELFNVLDQKKGLNCSFVKTQDKKFVFSEETIEKISNSLKGENNPFYGKKHSECSKQKMREANLGRTVTEETRKKLSEASLKSQRFKGKKHTAESKIKISKSLEGNNNHNYKEIVATSPNGTLYKNGISGLKKELNISDQTIYKLLKGGTSEKYAGWTFKYAEQQIS